MANIFRSIFREKAFNKIFSPVFDKDPSANNLETENGFNLLQENGDFILI
jgi:peptidoglycan biosynthesis protein MviN/MurJ (putative lipid II flippase)